MLEFLHSLVTSSSPEVQKALDFIVLGGPAIWAISALSVATVALILWKVWNLLVLGAWSGGGVARLATTNWQIGKREEAIVTLQARRTCRAVVCHSAMTSQLSDGYDQQSAHAETTRVAAGQLAQARAGLRALELIATIAPLLGLLGTVLGMIAAFQALQEAGSRADPSLLAGGIWEALLTTAAGMGVAIPASVALTWFESVVDRLQREMEDLSTRIFLPQQRSAQYPIAAQ